LKKSLLLRPGQVIRHVCASGIAMFWGSRQAILAASEAPEGSGRLNPHAKTAQYRPEICTMSRNRQKKTSKSNSSHISGDFQNTIHINTFHPYFSTQDSIPRAHAQVAGSRPGEATLMVDFPHGGKNEFWS